MYRWICNCGCACPPDHELKCQTQWFDSGWECPYNHKPYSWLSKTVPQTLRCKNCRWLHFQWFEGDGDEDGVPYVSHPANGWWEPARQHQVYAPTLMCGCQYYDEKGCELADRTPFFTRRHRSDFFQTPPVTRHRRSDFHFRQLRIDYIHGDGVVKYYDANDHTFNDDVGPPLRVRDVVAVASLKPLLSALQMFQVVSVARLRRLRHGGSSLASALPLMALHRFHCCSREIWRAVAQGKSDAVWVEACKLQWSVVAKDFTEDHMRMHDALFVNTVCYLAKAAEHGRPELAQAAVAFAETLRFGYLR